jgi:hypothetical protein
MLASSNRLKLGNLHNIPSLIDELAGIAERWRFNSRYQSHAEKVQQELRQSTRKESDSIVPTSRASIRSFLTYVGFIVLRRFGTVNLLRFPPLPVQIWWIIGGVVLSPKPAWVIA